MLVICLFWVSLISRSGDQGVECWGVGGSRVFSNSKYTLSRPMGVLCKSWES